MILPRRTPWASSDEFEHVFALLFSSQGAADAAASQQKAINRIHTWQAKGFCPFAAEATASLVQVILRDSQSSSRADQHTSLAAKNELRLSYSMALIRFVNGLVDPAQQGSFARSIAGIAQQIGLPLWFVELRHAATHEDLPSLPVLREAARKALDWLYTRYWIPQVQPVDNVTTNSAADDSEEQLKLAKEQLRDMLGQYKRIQKQVLRDATVAKTHDKEIQRLERALEKWIVEASLLVGETLSTAASTRSSEAPEETSSSGCRVFAEVLSEVGNLVPSAKKKRCSARNADLPEELVHIWEPLLDRLSDTFDSFTTALVWHLLDVLLNAEATDKSYMATIRAWAVHVLADLNEDDKGLLEEVLRFCLINQNQNPQLQGVLNAVAHKAGPGVVDAATKLTQVHRSLPGILPSLQDEQIEAALARMESRARQVSLMEMMGESPRDASQPTATGPSVGDVEMSTSVAPTARKGSRWQLVDASAWRPCPMGMFPDGRRSIIESTA